METKFGVFATLLRPNRSTSRTHLLGSRPTNFYLRYKANVSMYLSSSMGLRRFAHIMLDAVTHDESLLQGIERFQGDSNQQLLNHWSLSKNAMSSGISGSV